MIAVSSESRANGDGIYAKERKEGRREGRKEERREEREIGVVHREKPNTATDRDDSPLVLPPRISRDLS